MWDFFIILRFLIAGILAYCFFRRALKLQDLAAFIGAVAFMFCGHLVFNLNLMYIGAVMLLPGLLYTFEMLLETPNLKNLALTAILISLVILGGHPEPTFFALFYASCYYLFRCLTGIWKQKPRGRKLLTSGAWFLASGLLSFLLSAIMLIPFLEFLELGNSGIHTIEYFQVGIFSLSPSHIVDLWVPYFRGSLFNATWDGSNWQLFPGYIGIMVVLMVVTLALHRFAFQGKSLFFTGMILFFVIKAYNLSPSFNNFIGSLPLFRISFFTRYFPGEFMFSTAALAGVFVQCLLDGQIRMRYLALSVFLGLASLAGMLGFYRTTLLEHNKWDYAIQQALPSATLCLLTGLGAFLQFRKEKVEETAKGKNGEDSSSTFALSPLPFTFCLSDKIFAWFLSLLLIAELFFWMPKTHYKGSEVRSYEDLPPHIKVIKEDPGVFRVYGLDTLLFPTVASGYGLDDLGTIDGLINQRYVTFFRELIRPYSNFYITGSAVPDVQNRFFSFLNLKYITTALWTELPGSLFTLVYQQEAKIFRNEYAFPRAFIVHRAEASPSPEAVIKRLKDESFDLRRQIVLEEAVKEPSLLAGCGENKEPCLCRVGESCGLIPVDNSVAEIVSYTSSRVVIKTHLQHNGFLVLGDPYFPGWKAFVDGKEKKIYLTNLLVRSVFLDRGDHTVEFCYQPISYKLGAWLTLMGIGGVAAIFSSKWALRDWYYL
jgi:hypothetical protein